MTIVNELAKINAHRSDASRTLGEWVQSHLDVSRTTAAGLVSAARNSTKCRRIEHRLGYGGATFDRVVEMHRFVEAGATEAEALETSRLNLEDLRKMRVRRRRMTAADERTEHADRHFTIQPSLDEGAWTIHGRLPGLMGRIVDKAIAQKADELRLVPGAEQSSRSQRQADALVALMQDSLGGDTTIVDSAMSGQVTVFVDARTKTVESCGGFTAEIPFGPRVGPETLEALLCGGTVRVIGLDTRGKPVATTDSARAIPKATRDSVLFRDGGCTIDGCGSRYRLEPHHIIPRSEHGAHDPTNLTTLCWYHHHIAIHTNGYIIDPDTAPNRRRLVNPKRKKRAPPLDDW
ncbi:MAG: DUF222 domain-containing protein [Acidimicrobiia bacterium]